MYEAFPREALLFPINIAEDRTEKAPVLYFVLVARVQRWVDESSLPSDTAKAGLLQTPDRLLCKQGKFHYQEGVSRGTGNFLVTLGREIWKKKIRE